MKIIENCSCFDTELPQTNDNHLQSPIGSLRPVYINQFNVNLVNAVEVNLPP